MTSRQPGIVKEVTVDSAAAAYAQHDNVGTPREITNAVLDDGGVATITSLGAITGGNALSLDLELHFFDANPTVGADNAAFAPTYAELADKWLGAVTFATGTSWLSSSTVGEVQSKLAVGLKLKAAAGSKSIWVHTVYRTAAGDTLAANGITYKIGLDQN